MKLAFLFGSGISQKAGIKKVSEITDIILSGKNIWLNVARYHILPPSYNHYGVIKDENVNRIVIFLNILKEDYKTYNKSSKREINYEDLYYFVNQLDEMYNEQKDLFVMNYKQKLETNKNIVLKASNKIYPGVFQKKFYDFTFNELINEAKTYISNIVANLLSQPTESISYLDILNEIIYDKEVEEIDIFTLNHDILLEKCFDNNKIEFCDGFESDGDYRIYNEKLFEQNNKVDLLKLHGSVDWERYRYNGFDWRGDFIAKCILNSDRIPQNKKGETFKPIERTSKILMGTRNKLDKYNFEIFSDLMCNFKYKINESNYLIISGYGFGDIGINAKILDWYYKNNDNKIILIHKNYEEIKNTASWEVGSKMDGWKKEDRLLIIPMWFEKVTWKEIKVMLEK